MKVSKKNSNKSYRKYISLVYLIFFLIISSVTLSKCQSSHFISYQSKFFSLYLEDGRYFSIENYNLDIKIELFYVNNCQHITLKLELLSKEDFLESYTVEKKYIYNAKERTIYKNNNKIGLIPIFLDDNLYSNNKVTLASFNNNSLMGTFHKSNGKEPYDWVIVDNRYYTIYYYDFNDVLIMWEIGNSYDLTLHHIFGIKSFYGFLALKDTNYELYWTKFQLVQNIFRVFQIFSIIAIFISSILACILGLIFLTRNVIKPKRHQNEFT